MNIRILAPGLLVLALAACNNAPPPPSPPNAPASTGAQTAIGRKVEQAMAEARRKLATENITLNGKDGGMLIGRHTIGSHDPNLPKAEITPQGDLLIEGKAVSITPAQRQELLTYRARIIGIAEAGMAIGGKGADLAGEALGGVVGAIFGGKEGEKAFEQRMEAQGKKMEAEAMKLCTQLPGLLSSQQALAASLPEFKPYARMTQADIDDCGKDVKGKGVAVTDGERDRIREDIRREIREGVRETVQTVVPGK